MPLYEYECQQCHRHTEKRQKFSDPEITECPHCGGKLQRVLSAPAISFKGGGWYADGYGNAKPKPAGENAAKSESAAKPEGSSAAPAAASSEGGGKVASSSEGSPAPAATPAPVPTKS